MSKIKGRAARRKGHDFEREVANALKQLYPAAKRGLQNQGGGAAVPDVEGTPAWIECKRYKRVPGAMSLWYRLLKEAQRPPVLILREDRAKPVAMVSLGFLVGLLDSVGDDLTAIEQKGQEILEVGDELPVVAPPDRSADSRLAHLPDDLRAVAVEFLDLYGAWDTEFEASIDVRDEVTLRWSDYTAQRGVTEYAQADIHKAKGFRLTWGRNGFDGFIGKIEAKDSPLRRSADFAEFVQRFRRVGG